LLQRYISTDSSATYQFSVLHISAVIVTGPHVNSDDDDYDCDDHHHHHRRRHQTLRSSLTTQYATVSIQCSTVHLKMAPITSNQEMQLQELRHGHTNFHSSSSTDQRYIRSSSLYWHSMSIPKFHWNNHTCDTAATNNTPVSVPENQLHHKSIFSQK
jgi:hypothetical protein